jgi:hypothetical protein
MVELTQFLIPIFQIIASGATAIALGVAIWVYHKNRKTEQIRLVESIYKDIRELERERAQLSMRDSDSTNIETWRSRFFNTLEWLSFWLMKMK